MFITRQDLGTMSPWGLQVDGASGSLTEKNAMDPMGVAVLSRSRFFFGGFVEDVFFSVDVEICCC